MGKKMAMLIAIAMASVSVSFADEPPPGTTVFKNCTVANVGYDNAYNNTVAGPDFLVVVLLAPDGTTRYDFALPVESGNDLEVNRVMSFAMAAKSNGWKVSALCDAAHWRCARTGYNYGKIVYPAIFAVLF
jgi:hypothetical protein